jgi:hypothetical protein
MLEAERILMVDLTATQLQAKGAAHTASREGDQTEVVVAKPRTCHHRPPPMERTGCTVNWQRFTPSPPHNWQSVPIGAGLAQPLTRLAPGHVGGGPPWTLCAKDGTTTTDWFLSPVNARTTGPPHQAPTSLMGSPEGRVTRMPHAESAFR